MPATRPRAQTLPVSKKDADAARERLARWTDATPTNNERIGKPDPSWLKPKKEKKPTVAMSMPVSKRDADAARARLARWEATPISNARIGRRFNASSQSSSGGSSDVEEEQGTTSAIPELVRRDRSLSVPIGHRPFTGFTLQGSADTYEPSNGIGPALLVESKRSSKGTEHALSLDTLKVSVVEPASRPEAPEREARVTVSKRIKTEARMNGEEEYEVVYTTRAPIGLMRGRGVSLDGGMAAAMNDRGDPSAVRTSLERAARLYGTTTDDLVEAVRLVAPPAMEAPLAAALVVV